MSFTINIYYTGENGSAKEICRRNGIIRSC